MEKTIYRHKKGYLWNRDIELLRYLLKQRVVLSVQINRDVFNGVGRRAVQKRLDKLIEHDFIQKFRFMSSGANYYFLSQGGVDFLSYWGLISFEFNARRVEINSNQLGHDLLLVDICYAFRQLPLVTNIYTANDFLLAEKSQEIMPLRFFRRGIIPDLLVQISVGDKVFNIAVELELTTKKIPELLKKMEKYYLEDSVDYVFYLHDNKYVENFLKKREKAVMDGVERKIFFTSLKKFISDPLKTTFYTWDNSYKIELRWFLDGQKLVPLVSP